MTLLTIPHAAYRDKPPLVMKPYFRRRDGRNLRPRVPAVSYTPLQIATAYGFPISTTAGSGQTVGIVELGGAVNLDALKGYMQQLRLPVPKVNIIPVNGAKITPDPGGADVEVMLDVEIVAAIAPGCTINVYFGDNSDQGFAACCDKAASECDVVSISWGAAEKDWSADGRKMMDAAFQKGATASVSIYAAAGDNGSSDGTVGIEVDYPASSPFVIGCGGTALVIQGGSIISETVWNNGNGQGATGGGFSKFYPMPDYQKGFVNGSMRGVPDVAGVADPQTGWLTSDGVVGGTSAVAPMWAAINAILNQKAGKRLGFADLLYYHEPLAFRDTITGSNGAFNAGPGWDATTGLGSPDGVKLLALVGDGGGNGTNPPPPPSPTGNILDTVAEMFTDLEADATGKQQKQIAFAGRLFDAYLRRHAPAADASIRQVVGATFVALETKWGHNKWVMQGLQISQPLTSTWLSGHGF